MPTLQDLPNENILEIIRCCKSANSKGIHITKVTLCNLRLVSRHLSVLVFPLLFATVRLEFRDTDNFLRTKDHSRCHGIIIALAIRSTTAFKHTRKLVMRTEKLFWTHEGTKPGITQAKRYLNERIFDIISAFKSLQSIEYFYNPIFDPQDLATNLIHALATLPFFENLSIRFVDSMSWYTNIPQSITLQPLSNLLPLRICWGITKPKALFLEIASLLARCPNLTEFALDQMYTRGVTLHQDVDKMETEWKLEKNSY